MSLPITHKIHCPLTDRFRLVLTVMIGSMISSSFSRICANSFTTNSKSMSRGFASILSSPLSSGAKKNVTPTRGTFTGGLFRRYGRKDNSNEMKESAKNTTLFMSSAAALSVSGVVALEESKKNDDNTTLCADNDVNPPPNTQGFPEEALRHDTYNGVTINVSKLPADEYMQDGAEKFVSVLGNSLQNWKNDKKRGIWINIPTECSMVVPKCVELGFEFQHAKSGLLVMTKWLPEDQASRLPHGPTHQVGVGVIVVHPVTKKMLVVQEKTGPAAARKLWKMPTGLTDPGEDIVDAAVREAKEETGLDCVFDRIICMRQAHGGIFNQSDMFVVCLLKLSPKYDKLLEENKEIVLTPQEEEIAMISWMDLDEFSNQELWQNSPLYMELHNSIFHTVKGSRSSTDEGENNDSNGLIAKSLPLGYRPGQQTIYLSQL